LATLIIDGLARLYMEYCLLQAMRCYWFYRCKFNFWQPSMIEQLLSGSPNLWIMLEALNQEILWIYTQTISSIDYTPNIPTFLLLLNLFHIRTFKWHTLNKKNVYDNLGTPYICLSVIWFTLKYFWRNVAWASET